MFVKWVCIDSSNGLSPVRRQAVASTNAGVLSIGRLGTKFNENQIRKSEFYHFHSRKCIWSCHLPKWWPFCPGEMSWLEWMLCVEENFVRFMSCYEMFWVVDLPWYNLLSPLVLFSGITGLRYWSNNQPWVISIWKHGFSISSVGNSILETQTRLWWWRAIIWATDSLVYWCLGKLNVSNLIKCNTSLANFLYKVRWWCITWCISYHSWTLKRHRF